MNHVLLHDLATRLNRHFEKCLKATHTNTGWIGKGPRYVLNTIELSSPTLFTPETPVTSDEMDGITCDTEGPISDDDEPDIRRIFLDAAHSHIPT